MPFFPYKKSSKGNWGLQTSKESDLRLEHIKLGAQLRMADAMEAMAKNHDQLIKNRDYWKKQYEYARSREERYYRSNIALRGQITKLKKRLDRAES